MNIRMISLTMAMVAAMPLCMVRAQSRDDVRLIQKLTGRNELIRMQTLDELESNHASRRASLPQLVAAVQEIASNTKSDEMAKPSVVRLITLISKNNNDMAEQALIELLDSPHLGIAMVAADTLGKKKFHGAIDFLKKQTSRTDYRSNYAFRFNLIRSLIQMEHPDAIEFVSEHGRNLDGQLKHKIEKRLDQVTVEHFRGDEERFREWSQSRKRKSILQQTAAEPESLNRIRLSTQQYYGIDIHAKRLMFIIDRSGSMREYDGGQTRLNRAKNELTRVIEALPEETEFAIISYDSQVRVWRDELVLATKENKRRATYFISKLGYGSFTNTHGALRLALEYDDDLEAVFLLTDGRPTAGDIIRPNAIIADIMHRNRFRHLNFSTIGIAVEGPTEQFLKELAAESDGEFRTAE